MKKTKSKNTLTNKKVATERKKRKIKLEKKGVLRGIREDVYKIRKDTIKIKFKKFQKD